MRAHIIENGIVTNTIEVESLDFMPGLVDADLGGSIGDRYENGEFIKPAPEPTPVPASCSWRQGQKALLRAGKLEAAIADIDAIEDPFDKQDAQIEFGSPTYERASPFLQATWAQLGGTPEELDDLFRMAVTL